jgi:hypothetical protein
MKRSNEYTPEEIENLARECERLAERVAELLNSSDQLLKLSERFHWIMEETLDHVEARLRDLRHIVATARKELPETPSDNDLPF